MPTRYKETFKGITFYHFVAAAIMLVVVTIIAISWTEETNKQALGWVSLLLVAILSADFVKSLAHARAVTRLDNELQVLRGSFNEYLDAYADCEGNAHDKLDRINSTSLALDEKLDQIIAHFNIAGNEDNDTSIDDILAESMEQNPYRPRPWIQTDDFGNLIASGPDDRFMQYKDIVPQGFLVPKPENANDDEFAIPMPCRVEPLGEGQVWDLTTSNPVDGEVVDAEFFPEPDPAQPAKWQGQVITGDPNCDKFLYENAAYGWIDAERAKAIYMKGDVDLEVMLLGFNKDGTDNIVRFHRLCEGITQPTFFLSQPHRIVYPPAKQEVFAEPYYGAAQLSTPEADQQIAESVAADLSELPTAISSDIPAADSDAKMIL